jgi:alpha-L-fucosidase 2
MKKALLIILMYGYCTATIAQTDSNSTYTKGFTSWLPAASADDALLLGNGTMGAMVYGLPHNETIILNHADLYMPLRIPEQPIKQYKVLGEIKDLLFEGNGTEAEKVPLALCKEAGFNGKLATDPFIPAFDVNIKTNPAYNVTEYERGVDFEKGEAYVRWNQNGNAIERTQFISRADSVMVIRIKSEKPINISFAFDRRDVPWDQWKYINEHIKRTEYYANGNHLHYKSEFNYQWEGNIASYEGVGEVIAQNGVTKTEGNAVVVSSTTDAMLIVKIETHKTGQPFKTDKIKAMLEKMEHDYDKVLASHVAVHSELFKRVQLNLGGSVADAEMDAEIMMTQAKTRFSPTFVEKQFYAARYNILSATGKKPPNLQGIWSSSWLPPWQSDYTHDGNVPVAISSYLCANMPELMNSYFDYHDARLNEYRVNAKNLFGCRGIMVPSHSSSHGLNQNYGPVWCLNFWTGGAAWAAHFYYDYWLYTNDRGFLENRAYPFMKEAALFYEDFLTIGADGKYVFNPSYSPENNPANNPSQAVVNATMDVMLAKELLRNLIKAGKTLKESKYQLRKWEVMLVKMPEYEVDSTGALREWLCPGYEENHHHRHVSHLYGMYDMIDPDLKTDPVLWEGVRKAVEERMKVRRNDKGGIMVFGLVQLAWVAENLGDPELAQDIISWLSAQYWSNSLATFHDPNGLFNMDLSGGFQSVIIRALIYSEPGYLSILPAKPPVWETGSVSGILARNQVEVKELKWDSAQVTVRLVSLLKQRIKLQLPKTAQSIKLEGKSGKLIKYNKQDQTATIDMVSNQELKVTINLRE